MSKRSEQQHDEILEKLNQLLEQNKSLAQQNAQKDDEIALLKEQNNYLMQKLFGSKKETIMDPDQGSLFDDQLFSQPEQTGEQSDEEVIIEKYSRRKKRKGLKEEQLKHLPTVDHIHEAASCTCPTCQESMKEISTSLV